MSVPESMEPTTRDLERIQNRPEFPLHHLVPAVGPADLIGEKQSHRVRFPASQVEPQKLGQEAGHRQRLVAGPTLCGLDSSVPCRPANEDELALEIEVVHLQRQKFSGANASHREK